MGGKATTEIEHKVIRQDWLDGNSIASLSKKYKRDKDTIKETQSCTQTLDLCMLVDYYQGIVQYLKNWKKPAPKIKSTDEESAIK